jgi:hypothetical protein
MVLFVDLIVERSMHSSGSMDGFVRIKFRISRGRSLMVSEKFLWKI